MLSTYITMVNTTYNSFDSISIKMFLNKLYLGSDNALCVDVCVGMWVYDIIQILSKLFPYALVYSQRPFCPYRLRIIICKCPFPIPMFKKPTCAYVGENRLSSSNSESQDFTIVRWDLYHRTEVTLAIYITKGIYKDAVGTTLIFPLSPCPFS